MFFLLLCPAIFGSALSYVQEKEEPVDFLDLFLEMD